MLPEPCLLGPEFDAASLAEQARMTAACNAHNAARARQADEIRGRCEAWAGGLAGPQ